MEILVKYEIWELDKEHGLKAQETYTSYRKSFKERVVLLEPTITQTHDSFNDAVKEIEDKGVPYIEYTIIPRIYKTT